jgi:hypothetical protein
MTKLKPPTSLTVMARCELREIAKRMRKYAPSLRGVGETASDAQYNRTIEDIDRLMDLSSKIEVPFPDLSTSSAERGLREALEKAAEQMLVASVRVAATHNLLSLGLRSASEQGSAALSPKGEG